MGAFRGTFLKMKTLKKNKIVENVFRIFSEKSSEKTPREDPSVSNSFEDTVNTIKKLLGLIGLKHHVF